MHTVLERGRDAHRKPCAHFYCVPALFACIPTTFPTQSHHSRLDKVFIEMHPRYLTAVLVIHFKQNSHQEVRFMKQNMHTPPLQRFRMHMHESKMFLCCLGSFSWLRSDVRRRMILKGDTVCSCPLVLGLSTSHLCRCRSEPISGLSSTKDTSS